MNRYSRISTVAMVLAAIAAGCSSAPLSEEDAAVAGDGATGASASKVPSRDAWRRQMAKTPTPKDGCFRASHPSTEWVEVPCGTAPAVPFRPVHGGAPQAGRPMTVGNGTDTGAAVSGKISWAEGSFPSVSGVTSVTDNYGNPDNFSLQLNSNFLSGSSACSGASSPSSCLAWQQFVYSSGEIFMQYWLINYDNTCPAGWGAYGGDCYTNSNAQYAPYLTQADLATLTLTGTSGGSDMVTLGAEGEVYTVSQPSEVGLSQLWSGAEFNIFGNGDGLEAVFNSGSTMTVQTLTDVAPGSGAPTCASEGFTAETNSLSLVGSCCPVSGSVPGIQFAQSNVSGAPGLSCGGLPSGTFNATILSGTDDECLIFSGNGTNEYPSRYLWGATSTWCGFSSEAVLLANKQAVFTFVPLGGGQYIIMNASDGAEQCLIFSGNGTVTYPQRYLWGGGTTSTWCGLGSEAAVLANKQAVWQLVPLQGNQYAIMNASSGQNECLIFGGNGLNEYPSRYLWSSSVTYCGFPSLSAELTNEQSVWIIEPLQ